MSTIIADELEVGYGELPVCPPVSFAAGPGETLAVVGANGVGKSTLLRTVMGLLEPLAGTVEVLGGAADPRDGAFRAAVSADLGDDAFFPGLNVTEHLLLVAHGHGVADPDGVVGDLLAELDLEHRATALPAALSSGQRRRVLLAAALARPREVLVLDEPEQRLDAGMRTRLAERLVAERAQGTTILLASHDADLVARCATGAVVVSEHTVHHTDGAGGAAAIRAL